MHILTTTIGYATGPKYKITALTQCLLCTTYAYVRQYSTVRFCAVSEDTEDNNPNTETEATVTQIC